MGVLDEAIREHLDLKRARGADPTEIERLEREALGPVRREPLRGGLRLDGAPEPTHADEPAHEADGHLEYHDSTAPHWQGDHFEEHFDPRNGVRDDRVEAAAPEPPKRRGFLRRRGGASHEPTRGSSREPEQPPVVEPEHYWPEHDAEADHLAPERHEPERHEPEHFPEGHFEPERFDAEPHEEPTAHVGDGTEHPHEDGPATELHQVVELEPLTHPLDEPSEAGAATAEESASLLEPELEHPLGPVEPVATEPVAPEPVAPEPVAPEPSATSRKATPGPATEAKPPGSSTTPPPLHFEKPPRRPRFSTEPPGLVPAEPASPNHRPEPGHEELARTSEFDVQEHLEAEQLEDDVLEETPEFLQDTPEHDRLWFEQRPPRDFDFDG